MSKQSTPECDRIYTSKCSNMGELRFCVLFKMWSSISLILLCQATLANDRNHADITTEPHRAHLFLNTRCSIFPSCSWLPRLAICLEITLLKLPSHHPRVNELTPEVTWDYVRSRLPFLTLSSAKRKRILITESNKPCLTLGQRCTRQWTLVGGW